MVAHVGRIAQELEGVEEGVGGGALGGHDVDEQEVAAGRQDPGHLGEHRTGLRGVVRGEPRRHDGEAAALEGQR